MIIYIRYTIYQVLSQIKLQFESVFALWSHTHIVAEIYVCHVALFYLRACTVRTRLWIALHARISFMQFSLLILNQEANRQLFALVT